MSGRDTNVEIGDEEHTLELWFSHGSSWFSTPWTICLGQPLLLSGAHISQIGSTRTFYATLPGGHLNRDAA